MAVSFRILGPLEICVDDGVTRTLPEGREAELLRLLLRSPGATCTQQGLLAALWGQDAAPTNLHASVSRLRRRLTALDVDPRIIATSHGGYRVAIEDADVDLLTFRALVERAKGAPPAQAADLLAAGLALWREPPPAELAEERLEAIEVRNEALLALGEGPDLVNGLRELVAEHPFRERLCGQLMVALTRAGRQVEALAVYGELRARLDRDLGLSPGPQLRALETAVLQHDPSLFPKPTTTLVREPPGSAPAPAPVREAAGPVPPNRRARRRTFVAGAAVVAVAVAAAAAAITLSGTSAAPPAPIRGTGALLIDARSLSLDAAVAGGRSPSAIAVSGGSVWLADAADGTLVRIDPLRRTVVDTLGLGAAAGDLVATAAGLVAPVMNPPAAVLVDERLIDVTGRVALPAGGGPTPAAARGGDVWVAPLNAPVVRLDVSRLRLRHRFGIHGDGGQPAVTIGAAWIPVANPGAVVRIDLNSGALRSLPTEGVPAAVVAAGSGVWVATRAPDRLLRLDADGQMVASLALPDPPGRLAVGQTGVWVLSPPGRSLVRVTGDNITGRVRFAATPQSLATGAGGVWVSLHQGAG